MLKEIIFPNSLSIIEEFSFQSCSELKSITITKNIFNIKGAAFDGCSKLSNVTIESADIYSSATSTSACGWSLEYATTVKVLKSAMGTTDANTGHAYLNSTNFNVDTTSDVNYVIYTIKQ